MGAGCRWVLPPLGLGQVRPLREKEAFFERGNAFQAEGIAQVKAQSHAEDTESSRKTEYFLRTVSEPQGKVRLTAQCVGGDLREPSTSCQEADFSSRDLGSLWKTCLSPDHS